MAHGTIQLVLLSHVSPRAARASLSRVFVFCVPREAPQPGRGSERPELVKGLLRATEAYSLPWVPHGEAANGRLRLSPKGPVTPALGGARPGRGCSRAR